jgi:hypothetical protein
VSVYFFDRAPKILNTIPVQAKFTKVNTTGTGQTVCDAPDPTVIREIDEIVIANVDTVAAAITVTLVDTQRGNTAQVVITLQTNESLTYNSGNGWNAYDANGSTKRLLPATSIPWDAPGTIGSTTPNTGAFTTLSASGLLTLTGGQISFPATQVPSADPNTLDDYEELSTTSATVTPGAGAFTTVAASYEYTKTGNEVNVRVGVTITTNGTASGVINVNIPFLPVNTTAAHAMRFSGGFQSVAASVQNSAGQGVFSFVALYDGTTYAGGSGVTLLGTANFRV